MVRDFQKVIGEEARRQILEAGGPAARRGLRLRRRRQQRHRDLPRVPADDPQRAAGRGRSRRPRLAPGRTRRAFPRRCAGRAARPYSYLLQDDDGQMALTHSVSAGLDYALIGPEHAWLHDQNRAEYVAVQRQRGARRGPHCCRRTEGLIPALESAHAVAEAVRRAPPPGPDLPGEPSGRGDKDIDIYRENSQGTRCRTA